jgi:hypothetical protein
MAIVYTGTKCKNPKKKPGWKETEAQQAEWLKKVNSITLFTDSKKKFGATTVKKPSTKPSPVQVMRPQDGPAHSLIEAVPIGGTKKVLRPEIQYKDDPEMLARELKARERKFSTAPAYNKGNAVLITDEMMKDITAGITRRR